MDMYCPVTRQPSKDCPHECCKPSENDTPLFNRLLSGQIASCGCMVKTNETKYHHPLCHYRLLDEAAWELQRLQGLSSGASGGLKPDHLQTSGDGSTTEPDGDAAEAAYWRFDARRGGLGPWKGMPQSERDAFKAEYRNAASVSPEPSGDVAFALSLLRPAANCQPDAERVAVLRKPEASALLAYIEGPVVIARSRA